VLRRYVQDCEACQQSPGRAGFKRTAAQPNARLANPRNLRDNNNLPSVCWASIRKGFSGTVLMIRLARIGARKQPYYRVVVIDKERARNGRSVEVVGLYNPRTNPTTIDLKRDRIDYWVSKGAQLSDTVGRLLTKSKAAVAPAA
jgi:small subunit ribosomal protein S16